MTRVATAALTQTGLSREAACFQARSAFTGTGFTTRESKKMVGNPLRRRIVMMLMIVRSAGLVTTVVSLILSFMDTGAGSSRLVDRFVQRGIFRALDRFSNLGTRGHASLLRLSGDFTVAELEVQEDGWLVNRCLDDMRLPDERVTVLGFSRGENRDLSAPRGTARLRADDTVILYGHVDTVSELDRRRADTAGEQDHHRAVERQRERDTRQEQEEREQDRRRRENWRRQPPWPRRPGPRPARRTAAAIGACTMGLWEPP